VRFSDFVDRLAFLTLGRSTKSHQPFMEVPKQNELAASTPESSEEMRDPKRPLLQEIYLWGNNGFLGKAGTSNFCFI
jgi:hypothetical protein